MPYPAFLARTRMVTRVLAKTTKVKNNFINGKKKFKRILSRLFGERQKVQVTNLPSLLVLLRTRSVQRLSSLHLAAVLTLNLAELVPSDFFWPQPSFLQPLEHIFPGKTPVFIVAQ